jgi:hypothetical protein
MSGKNPLPALDCGGYVTISDDIADIRVLALSEDMHDCQPDKT